MKKLPYWLKTATIFGIIGLIWGVLGSACDRTSAGRLDFSCLIFIIPSVYFIGGHALDIVGALVDFILFFVFGAAVGSISNLFIKNSN